MGGPIVIEKEGFGDKNTTNAFYRNLHKKYGGRSAFREIRSLHIGNVDALWKATC